jgi:hypothetical protein
MAVVDPRIQGNSGVIVGKPPRAQAGTERLTFGTGEVQKGIIGIEQGEAVSHGGLLQMVCGVETGCERSTYIIPQIENFCKGKRRGKVSFFAKIAIDQQSGRREEKLSAGTCTAG